MAQASWLHSSHAAVCHSYHTGANQRQVPAPTNYTRTLVTCIYTRTVMSVIQKVIRTHCQYGQACTVQHVTTWLTLSMFAVLVLRLNPGCLVGFPGSMAAGSLAMFFICSSGAPCSVDLALHLPPDMLLAGQVVCPPAF